MIMMFKLVVFLVMMFGGANANHDDVKNDRQLSVHLANIVEQMTRLMDEFQVRMEKLEEKVEELPARMERLMDIGMNRSNNVMEEKMERLEEKMDIGMNRSNIVMEEKMESLEWKMTMKMESLEGKMEEIPRNMAKLEKMMDCHNWFASRSQKNGFYLDQSTGKIMTQDCKETVNMSSDWIVIQRRVSATVDFFRGWNDYKNGFGDPQGSFWLGLDNIHTICSRNCQLNITMSKVQNQDLANLYAHYQNFSINDEKDKYRLHVSRHHGNAGDGLSYHNGMQFSTKDNDNDKYSGNCAEHYTGAFWYNFCSDVNPNGQYFAGPPPHPHYKGIIWFPYTTHTESLKFIEMKVKPTS